MSEPLDNLIIDIQYKSSTASSGVDKLTTSLTSLRSATKGGVGLTAVSKQITNLNTSLSAVKGLDKISGLVTGLNGLQGIGKASGFTSTINSLKKLPTVIDELDKADLGKFNTQVETLVTIMRPLGTEMQKVSNGFSVLPKNIQKAINANAKLTTSNKKINTSYKTLRNNLSLTVAKFIAVVYAIRRVARAIGEWIDKSNQYQENLNLFRVSMGEYYDASLKYAKQVENTLGIDSAQWIRYQAVFQNMTEGFGVASDKAEIMSRNLTQMGYDLASVFNVEVDTAMEKLESALSGQPRPMREWGFDLSEASLKAVALSHGIDKNVEKMSQMEKAQLRYIYLYENMERLGLSGDFARTLEAPANALRVLNSQVGIAKRELGNMFIPMLNKMLPVVTAIVKVIRWVASEIASLLGFTMTDIDYSSLTEAIVMPDTDELATDDIADSLEGVKDNANDATDAVKELKKGLLGFDEINMLPAQPDAGVDGVADDLKDALDDIDNSDLGGFDLTLPDNADWLAGALEQRSNAIFEQYKKSLEPFVKWAEENFAEIGITAKDVLFNWDNLNAEDIVQKGLTGLFGLLGGITGFLFGGVPGAIKGTIAGVGIGLLVTSAVFDNDGKISEEEAANMVSGALGGLVGGVIGFKYAGVKGALIGASMGAAVTMALNSFIFKDADKSLSKHEVAGLLIPVVSSLLGAVLGSILGSPILGCLIGFTVGYAITFALKDFTFEDIKTYFSGKNKEGFWAKIREGIDDMFKGFQKINLFEFLFKGFWLGDKIVPEKDDSRRARAADYASDKKKNGGDSVTGTDVSTTFTDMFDSMKKDIGDWYDEMIADYDNFKKRWKERIDDVKQTFVDIYDDMKKDISDWWDGVKLWWSENISPYFAKKYWQEKWDNLINAAKEKIDEWKTSVSTKWNEIKDWVKTNILIYFTKEYWSKKFSGLTDAATQKLNELKNLFTNWTATIKTPHITWDEYGGWEASGAVRTVLETLNLPTSLPKLNVEWYAEGGHPAPGQLFIANEAGAEMVGNLNGRSTVANNQDIAAGIDEATYRGMMRAWNEQRAAGGGRQTVVPVQINGRTLFEVVVEENNSAVKATGATPLLV